MIDGVKIVPLRQIVDERGILEMADPGRVNARVGEPIVEPGRRAIAEVGARRLVDWREHLQQEEDGADRRQRRGQARPVLHRCHQCTHRDRKHGRQHAAERQDHPPCNRQPTSGLGQDIEELPLLPGAEAGELCAHAGDFIQSVGGSRALGGSCPTD